MLNRCDIICCFKQTRLRPSIEPRHASAQKPDVKRLLSQVSQIQIRDFQFPAGGWTQTSAEFHDLLVVHIEARDRIWTFRLLRFFLETDGAAVASKFDNAITFRISDLI